LLVRNARIFPVNLALRTTTITATTEISSVQDS